LKGTGVKMGKVIAVCISERKGTPKKNVGKGKLIENFGLEQDAHAGNWHRQISLLSYDKVLDFRNKGIDIEDGAFGENLLVNDIDFKSYPIGARFRCGEVLLEITQIGKTCHNECEIRRKVGDCIMPREGVFARVLSGGSIEVGDDLYAV
jgi:TatD DNase family protein